MSGAGIGMTQATIRTAYQITPEVPRRERNEPAGEMAGIAHQMLHLTNIVETADLINIG